MTAQTAHTLEFGLNAALPPDCPCAWGARAIEDMVMLERGKFDIPWDRKSSCGDALLRADMLRALQNDKALEKAAKALYKLWAHDSDLKLEGIHTVYSHHGYVIKARVAGGYVYLAAFPEPSGA